MTERNTKEGNSIQIAEEEKRPDAADSANAVAGGANDNKNKQKETGDTLTDATDESSPVAESEDGAGGSTPAASSGSPTAILSSTKKSRPPYKYDPDKITLRFLFANRDGLTVTVECKPSDTVGEVKGALLSVWPDDMPVKVEDLGGDNLRLICMGKGYLMPDTRTLEDCQVPVFKTHPTPINVSVKTPPKTEGDSDKGTKKSKKDATNEASGAGTTGDAADGTPGTEAASQGCGCIIL